MYYSGGGRGGGRGEGRGGELGHTLVRLVQTRSTSSPSVSLRPETRD